MPQPPLAMLPSPTIPYELRIGVTGHCHLDNPKEVRCAIGKLLTQDVLRILEESTAHPHGPHGTPQSRSDRFYRFLTRLLACGTRLVVPVMNSALEAVAEVWRWACSTTACARPWPAVPFSADDPSVERQTPVKLTVISSLAPGVDVMVSDIVRKLVEASDTGVEEQKRRNRCVEAVYPFPPKLYAKEFSNDAELSLFWELVALDRGVKESHREPTVIAGNIAANDPKKKHQRAEAFREAGRAVVDSSELILAVWDPDRKIEGDITGDTVRYAVDQGRLVLWLHPGKLQQGASLLRDASAEDREQASCGPIAWLLSSWQRYWHAPPPDHARPVVAEELGQAPEGYSVVPLPTRAKYLSANYHRLSAYNRDAAVVDEKCQRICEKEASALQEHIQSIREGLALCGDTGPTAQQSQKLQNEFLDGVHRAIVEDLLPHFAKAGQLAERYKSLRAFAARIWPKMTAFIVIFMAVQILLLPELHWLAVVEFAVVLLGYLSYRVSVCEAWHEKWLNDRHLAERMRSLFYRMLVRAEFEDGQTELLKTKGEMGGLNDPLPFYRPTNVWFEATFERIVRRTRRNHLQEVDWDKHFAILRKLIADAWVKPQLEHHRTVACDKRKASERAERSMFSLVILVLVLAVLHGLGVGHGLYGVHGGSLMWNISIWIGLATLVVPAWASAHHAIQILSDDKRLADRSAGIVQQLNGQLDQLEQVKTMDELRVVVLRTDKILEVEIREWVTTTSYLEPEFRP